MCDNILLYQKTPENFFKKEKKRKEMLTRLRELAQSFRNQAEPENTEQLKRTKAEVEKNVTRILKLIKNEGQGKKEGRRKVSKKETEILGLVDNFYKEYVSLCALYDHLVAGSGETLDHGRKEKECPSNSGSDSEYYSSEEIDINHGKSESEATSFEVAELKHELASVIEQNKNLKSKYIELKSEADKKDNEISALVKANEAHEKQSSARIRELEGQLAGLKTETESLQEQLGDKRKGWRSRILELESNLKEKEDENSALLRKLNENESTFTSKIEEIMAHVSNLQLEIASLGAKNSKLEEILTYETQNGLAQVKELMEQKTELEVQLERKTVEISDNVVQIESLKEELASKVDQSSLQIERENRNLQIVEKRIEDLAEKFVTSFEEKICFMYKRILVTEKLHIENKESYKLTKERYGKQNRELEEKITTYEAELRKMKELSELADYALKGLDMVVTKFEEEHDNFLTHISKVSNELQFAKKWVMGITSEVKRLKHNVDCLVAQLDDQEEQKFLLRDKVWKLEAKVSKEGGEKLNLIQANAQLEKKVGKYERQIKDKDERLLSLGDEKREAIRQLCILVDYHRSRFDHLKQVVSKMRL